MTDFLSPELEWFFVGLFCMIAEIVLPGFIAVFFGIGAWLTAILVWVGLLPGFDSQMISFLILTVLSLLLFRKRGKQIFGGKVSAILEPGEDLEEFKDEKGMAVTDITPDGGGRVEVRGTEWKAESSVRIAKGVPIRVLSRKNITLIVEPNTTHS